MLDQDLQAEVIEVTEAESAIDDAADGTVDTFDKALGHSVVKVVEELMPPVAQSVGKPNQVSTARDSGLPHPSPQKSRVRVMRGR